jgi:copper oxidase (laccase) domain-containing protein
MLALGASASRIVAVIGPCIAQASYEVGPDLRDPVLAQASDSAAFFQTGRRTDRWQFDLAGYCAARLRQAGLADVVSVGLDTLADEERFFSHRRRTLAKTGPIGHQISVISPA